jgi:solute carrier family 25, member 39/40
VIVTPLDVVRVRLQSQAPSPSSTSNPVFSSYTTSFKRLPPDLGVTACCREVFWVGDNAQFCIAGNNGAASATECAVEETQKRTFTSTLDGLRKIARNEGASSLWRGLSPTLLMAIPANVIYFTGYDWLRFNHASPINRITSDTYTPLVSGSVARVAAAIVVSPVEMFRTRMQATHGSSTGVFKSTLRGLHQMTQTQGYSSLWRGLTLTMWRDVPFSGIYWWGYEATRNALTDARERSQGKVLDSDRSMTRRRSQSQDNHTNTFLDSFVSGAFSGAVAAFVTTPFDVGKTRQQVFKHNGDETAASAFKAALKAGEKAPEELTMPRFLAHIFREEGITGLFKGWAARCLKVAPACAIMISSYEVGKRWARTMNQQMEDTKKGL